MISIDGAKFEGGGQMVRIALCLSALTGKPFEVTDIRRGRKKPGLKAQHLHAVRALSQLCDATAQGAELGSTRLAFTPGRLKPLRSLKVDIGTAGSITLLLQAILLPCIILKKSIRLTLRGGTDVAWSMPIDYFKEVYAPYLRHYCDSLDVKVLKRGFYPKGGGEVEIALRPRDDLLDLDIESLRAIGDPLTLEGKGELMSIKGVSHASSSLSEQRVAERAAKAAQLSLSKLGLRAMISTEYSQTLSPGAVITLWARRASQDTEQQTLVGADSLGERGKRAETMGLEAARRLKMALDAPVDEHLSDNLAPLLAIFGGSMRVRKISDHLRAAIYVIREFLGPCIELDEPSLLVRSTF